MLCFVTLQGLNLGGSGKIQKIRVCSGYEEDKESVWTVHKVSAN